MKNLTFSTTEGDHHIHIPREDIIWNGEYYLAFLDKYPISEGHTLIVCNTPTTSIYDLEDEVRRGMWRTVDWVKTILQKRYSPTGFNIGINEGASAGQTIAHAHIHVIPRYDNDQEDPRGGIRKIFTEKADYWTDMEGIPAETPNLKGN